MLGRALAPQEKVILAAVGRYCPPGTPVPIAWTDIEQAGGRCALIGPLSFPPDVNSRNPSEKDRKLWRLAIGSLEGHRLIKRTGPDLYDITDAGRERIEELRSSGRKTQQGKPAWQAMVERLEELVALQNQKLNPVGPRTDTSITVLVARLLELGSIL